MNSWSIPDALEEEIRARDKTCVYCGVALLQKLPPGSPRKALATWEHIVNDSRIVTRENIALCCCACNASKRQKTLVDWLRSPYCAKLGIDKENVAQVIRDALALARNQSNVQMLIQ